MDSAVRQRFGHGEYPNARHNQIALQGCAAFEFGRRHCALPTQFRELRLLQEFDTSRSVVALEETRHRGREEPLPDAILGQHHRRRDALLRQHRGYFHADEPGADNQRPLGDGGVRAHGFRVLQRPQVPNAGQILARQVEGSHAGASRYHELLEAKILAGPQVQQSARAVDPRNFATQLQFNPVLAVEFLRVDADALLGILSREKTLRQRRPFVWNGIIGRHDCKLARPQPALDHFLRGVTRDHSSTEDHVL